MNNNPTAIAEVFSRIDHTFDLMYSKHGALLGDAQQGLAHHVVPPCSDPQRVKICEPEQSVLLSGGGTCASSFQPTLPPAAAITSDGQLLTTGGRIEFDPDMDPAETVIASLPTPILLSVLGLEAQPNGGRGDCLYHAVGQALMRLQTGVYFLPMDMSDAEIQVIRRTVSGFLNIDQQKARYRPWFAPLDDGNPLAWERYVDNIRDLGNWGNHIDLLAFSDLWEIRILLIRPGRPPLAFGRGRPTFCLLLANRHFELLTSTGDDVAFHARASYMAMIPHCLCVDEAEDIPWHVIRGDDANGYVLPL